MHRSRSLFLSVSLALLLPIASGVLWSASSTSSSDDGDDSLYKYLSIFSEVFGLVRNNYVDPVPPEQLLAGAFEGVGDALDPFAALVPAGAAGDYERARTLARTRSGLLLVKDHGIAYALAVGVGSPAEKAGIERGDVVAEIETVDTRNEPLWRLERRLAGEPGETRAIRIVRQGEPSMKTVELGAWVPAAPKLIAERGVQVLRLERIEKGDAALVRALLEPLAADTGTKLVVDLQGVAGGDADEAFALAALFAQGELGRLERRGESVRDFRSDAPPVFKGELAATLDGGTLGAAEIVALVLEKRANAKTVGLKSFGWAGELSAIELSNGVRFHLTTAFYVGPEGATISGGVAPALLIDDLPRGFGSDETPLDVLIRNRAIDHLLGVDEAEAKAA